MTFFTIVEEDVDHNTFLASLWNAIWEFHEALWRMPEDDSMLPT